jgi:hypothetical protein
MNLFYSSRSELSIADIYSFISIEQGSTIKLVQNTYLINIFE